MTTNQINWVNAQENKRANLANEELKRQSNAITAAHNIADEQIRQTGNLITEGHYVRSDAEAFRANRANEELRSKQNEISEQEAATHKYEAKTGRMNAKVNQQNADTNLLNAYTNVTNAETNRMNALTNKTNAATSRMSVEEAIRHNVSDERLQLQRNQLTESYNSGMLSSQQYRDQLMALDTQNQISARNKQTDSTVSLNKAKEVELSATTDLQKEKTKTEATQRYLNTTRSVGNVSDVIKDWIPSLGD